MAPPTRSGLSLAWPGSKRKTDVMGGKLLKFLAAYITTDAVHLFAMERPDENLRGELTPQKSDWKGDTAWQQ